MLALLAVAAVGLTSCALGQPSGFAARTNATCREAVAGIDALSRPETPPAGITYGMDRYVLVEKAVSTLTDGSLPGGSSGDQLRVGWLRPARSSLRTGRDDLDRLRTAVDAGNRGQARSQFEAAAVAGTGGVDLDLLRSRHLDECVTLFTPAAPSTTDWGS